MVGSMRVVGSARQDKDGVVGYEVDDPVLLVDPPAIIPRQFTYERLWLPQPNKGIAFNLPDELVDFRQGFSILMDPKLIILPCLV
jgi:hypothetical protein